MELSNQDFEVGLNSTPVCAATAVEADDAVDVGDDDNEVDTDIESEYRDPPIGSVRLRPSNYACIPSTVFVEYPPELGMKRSDLSVVEKLNKRQLCYNSYWERICIRNAFKRAGFEKSDKNWTALWSKHQNNTQMREMNCLQKVNHFPASWCIGRKDRLARTLGVMKRIHGASFNFHPDSYIMPKDKESFLRQISVEAPKSAKSETLWIVKPVASSCGRGIRVMTSTQVKGALSKNRKLVVQRYLKSPYLIDGKKFDLRIYVLVSGVDPLRVYIHDEGLTRISTSPYSLKDIANRFAHLTNYSVNKKSKDFKAASMEDTNSGGREGFKWSLNAFKQWLAEKESPETMRLTFQRIHDLCVKTIIAAESEITPNLHQAANYRSNCYELFGCDVILDSNLNPYLLEVNVSPSLMGSSPLDKLIKGVLIADVLHVVGLYPHDPKLLKLYSASLRPDSASVRLMARQSDLSDSRTSAASMNPFAFSSVSGLMQEQDEWRKSPSPGNIDLKLLGDKDSAWMLMLLADDEFSRAESTQFNLVHPRPESLLRYLQMYKSHRFSDHLLGRWLLDKNANRESAYATIPKKFRRDSLEAGPLESFKGNVGKPQPRTTKAQEDEVAGCDEEGILFPATPPTSVQQRYDEPCVARNPAKASNPVVPSEIFQGGVGIAFMQQLSSYRKKQLSTIGVDVMCNCESEI